MISGRTWGKAGVLGAIFALASGGWTAVPGASVSAADVVCAGSIQSCIDAAAPGDTVVIPAGVYNESVVLTGAVSLRGAGPTQTVIDATGLASRPLTIDGVVVDSTVVIEELTRVLPDHTWLFHLKQDGTRLRLSGYTSDASSLIGLVGALPMFTGPKFGSPVTHDPRREKDRFNIVVEINTAAPDQAPNEPGPAQ